MKNRLQIRVFRFQWEFLRKTFIYTIYGFSLLIGGFVIGKTLLFDPSFLNKSSSYPTSIPWLDSKFDCEYSGRVWIDNKCWDKQHSSSF